MLRFSIPSVPSLGVFARIARLLSPERMMRLVFLGIATVAFPEDMEIVVSASRIEEDVRSTSFHVRIIPPEVISRADSILDALKTLPDIAIKTSAPGKSSISMGGFGENGFGRTLVLVDGHPINRSDMASVNWQVIPLDEILRIEVIKGPLSSQYGDQAIAGVINIVTRKPEGIEAWIHTNLSTNLTSRESLGIAWSDDKYYAQGGFHHVNKNATRERSDADFISANLKLGAHLRNLDLGLGGYFARSSYQLPGGLSESEYRSNPDKANKREDEVSETIWMSKFDLETSVGPLTFTFPVSWRHQNGEADAASDTWSSFTNSTLNDVNGGFQANIEIYPYDNVILIPIVGIDANWSKITVAAYNEKERNSRNSEESATRNDFALWHRFKVILYEHWVIDTGLRLTTSTVFGAEEKVHYMPFAGDFGGAWRPTENWTVRLKYGRVFRFPMLDEQVSYYTSSPSINTDLEPEFGHHATWSLEYVKDKYRIDVMAFFIAMNDEIAFDSANMKNANLDETHHIGGVLSLSRTGAVLGLSGSYALDLARYKNSGKRVPLVPLHSAYGRVSFIPVEPLEISTNARFTSGYYKGGDIDNKEGTVKGRLSLDARIDLQPTNDLNIYAKATNLLDDRTPTEVYWQSGEESWYPVEGREFSFGAIWRY